MITRRWASIIVLVGLWTASAGTQTPTAALEIRVKGLQSMDGQVVLALFDSQAAFDKGADPVRRTLLPIESDHVVWELEGLPHGNYALKAFHDVDGSGILERNAFGAPKEPYGISNNVRGRLGPPGWEKARFHLKGSTLQIVVKIK